MGRLWFSCPDVGPGLGEMVSEGESLTFSPERFLGSPEFCPPGSWVADCASSSLLSAMVSDIRCVLGSLQPTSEAD